MSHTDRLELTDHDLVQHLAIGRARRTPWSEVRCVRWVEAGHAEVVCDGEQVIELRGQRAEVEALVETLRDTALRTQRRWQTDGVPPELIRRWLGIRAGGHRIRRNSGQVYFAVYCACSGLVLLWMLLDPPGFAFKDKVFAVLSTFICAIAFAASGKVAPEVEANEQGLVCRQGAREWSAAWRDIRNVAVTRDSEVMVWTKQALDPFKLRLGFGDSSPILTALQGVAAANTATFAPAGDQPPPATALSPARLTGDSGIERGLSQSQE